MPHRSARPGTSGSSSRRPVAATTLGRPVLGENWKLSALPVMMLKGLPDAIFLDIELPDGNGFDVLATLRLHPSYTHLPIIMVTAKAESENVARGLVLGADGYITKPYGKNTLDYVLRYVMKQEALPVPIDGIPPRSMAEDTHS